MDLIEYFFNMVFKDFEHKDRIYLKKLTYLATYNCVGVEGVSAYYDESEEDYKEGYITIDLYNSSPVEKVAYIENKVFYEKLRSLCLEHINCKPEDRDEINICLNKIKENLNVIE